MSTEDIAVIGAGSYGTCLAMLFGNAGHRVSLYCRNAEQAVELETTRLALVLSPDRRSELSRRIGELLDEYAMRDDPDGEPWAIFVAQHRRPG